MLGTLVLPLLAGFLLLLGRMRKRADQFELDYPAVRHDLGFFLAAYGLALLASVVPARALHYAAAVGLLLMYAWYVKIHVMSGKVSELELKPLYFSRRAGRPPTALIVAQVLGGLGLLIGGAHLFVHVVKDAALGMGVSPLVLALLVAPVATELPETMNSFFWVHQKKDTATSRGRWCSKGRFRCRWAWSAPAGTWMRAPCSAWRCRSSGQCWAWLRFRRPGDWTHASCCCQSCCMLGTWVI